MDLTETQQAILALIAERIESEGMPPSQAEIAQAFGFKGVRGGAIPPRGAGSRGRDPARARARARDPAGASAADIPSAAGSADAIDAEDAVRLPVLGRSPRACRSARTSVGDSTCCWTACFFSPAPDYLLKVKGDSMRDEGIFDGDLIGVHRTRDARSGQIVVARIDEEITVKLLKIGKDRIRLLPRNPDYAPIEVLPDQDFAIEGLYCGLVRPNR